MLEAYSSREHQSAVDRLILLATSQKTSAPVMEEEPAVPETTELLGAQAESIGEPLQEQAADNAAPEAVSAESWVGEAAQTVDGFASEHPLHEEQVEPRHEEAAPVEADTEARASVEGPAPEAMAESDHAASAELAQAAAEPVSYTVAEPPAKSAIGEVRTQATEHEHRLHEVLRYAVEPLRAEAAPAEVVVEAKAPVERAVAEAAAEPNPGAIAELAQAVAEPIPYSVAESSMQSANDEIHEQAVTHEHQWAEVSEHASGPVPAGADALADYGESHSGPHGVLEETADDHGFHEEAVEPALVESVLAEHDTDVRDELAHEQAVGAAAAQPEMVVQEPEPVAEFAPEAVLKSEPEPESGHEQIAAGYSPAAEEALSEQIPHEDAVGEHAHHEVPTDVSAETAVVENGSAEESASGIINEPEREEVAASAEIQASTSQEVEAGGLPQSHVAEEDGFFASDLRHAAPYYSEEETEPFTLDKYLRRSTDIEPDGVASSPNVVPSPDETVFLQSKDLSEQPTEEELKELARNPMWKTLMQFKSWLPLVTRVLPLLDIAGNRGNQVSSGVSREVKESVDSLTVSQRDLRLTLQDQTLELKRVEEEVSRLRDTADKTAFEQSVTADEVKAVRRLLKNAFLYVGILLGLLVVAVGYMAFLVFTYLNTPTH